MAQKIEVLFIDDIDGSEAVGTFAFGLDGSAYEIDLNKKHADALRKLFAPYLAVARKSAVKGKRKPRRGERTWSATSLNGITPSANGNGHLDNEQVRSWAKQMKLPVKEKGRLPAEIVAQYKSAHA